MRKIEEQCKELEIDERDLAEKMGIFILMESLLPVAILSSQKSPSQCLHQGFQKKKDVIRFSKRQ